MKILLRVEQQLRTLATKLLMNKSKFQMISAV